MAKPRYGLLLIISFIILLGLVSFVSCFVAEIKKAKRIDLKWDGKLCHLPGSHAFGLGVAALVSISIAQIIGNLIICSNFCLKDKTESRNTKIPAGAKALLVFSWISFGVAVIFVGTATSMSRRQGYGKGWVDGECYLVKDGVFVGSGGLILAAIGSLLGAANLKIREAKVERRQKVHAKLDENDNENSHQTTILNGKEGNRDLEHLTVGGEATPLGNSHGN